MNRIIRGLLLDGWERDNNLEDRARRLFVRNK